MTRVSACRHSYHLPGPWLLTNQRDVFQPEMIQRFLAGYEPAQHIPKDDSPKLKKIHLGYIEGAT